MNMRIHFFLGACFLTTIVLVRLGAPVRDVVGGMAMAGIIEGARVYFRSRRQKQPLKNDRS